jgi:hypothetical protein
MRSNLILGVAAAALSLGVLSLGIGGASAATPTTNFLASSTGHVTDLFPAQAPSSEPGLSRITNSKHTASANHLATLAAAHTGRHAHIANLRAMNLAMRFVPSKGTASASRDGLNTLRQKMSPQPSGLAGLRNAAGLAQAAPPSPLAQQFALAAAKAQPNDSIKLLSSH